jgi:hypothetical protein
VDPIFIIPLLFLVGTGLIFYGFTHLKQQKKLQASWQRLAVSNNLSFASDPSRKDRPHVSGEYRGHYLELRTVERSDEYQRVPGTRVVLTTQKSKSSPKDEAGQPSTLEDAVRPFTATDPRYPLMGKIYATPGGRQVYYEQYGLETDVEYLQYLLKLLADLADAYPQILAFGSKAVPFLQKNADLAIIKGSHSLRPITIQLLQEITKDTDRWSYQTPHHLCPHCLARCVTHEVALSPMNFMTYYDCRICSQSEEFLDWAGPVVAILDRNITTELSKEKGALRVNWLVRRALFDFESVEIIQATDEEVERFAVQVGNDTDEVRQPRYKEMCCTVSPACTLSENTMRILKRTFGQVR